MNGRDLMVGRALDTVAWLEQRRTPFTCIEFGIGLELHGRRHAHRWLAACESRGLVEHSDTRNAKGQRLWEVSR